MTDWLDRLHPSLRPLWELENELRRAAQNAILLNNEEAKRHLAAARGHFAAARKALMGEVPAKASENASGVPVVEPPPASPRRPTD
ncbi:MAG: hypothetical protein WDN31_21995 [Hyphomicrobium sp.]